MQKKKNPYSEWTIKIFNKNRLSVTDFSFASGFNVAQLGTDPSNAILQTETFLPDVVSSLREEEEAIM